METIVKFLARPADVRRAHRLRLFSTFSRESRQTFCARRSAWTAPRLIL